MFVYLERFSNNQVTYLEHVFWASRDYKRMNRVLCKRLSTKYTRLVNVPSQKYTCFINTPLQKYKCFVKDLLQKATGFASEKGSSHDIICMKMILFWLPFLLYSLLKIDRTPCKFWVFENVKGIFFVIYI